MNKLFTRIAIATAGIAMAIGVGSFGSKVVREARADSATATFGTSDFSGKGTANTGSSMSATVDGVTLSTNKGYGTTQVRIYAGGSLTISSSNTITAISFTFSDSKTGGLQASYTGLSTTSWEQASLASQLRFTECVVTYTSSEPGVSYTISYNANGGSGTMSNTTGADPAVASCTFTAPEGKEFLKWNTAADGNGTDYAVGAKPGADLGLYAIWVQSTSVKYVLDATSLNLTSALADDEATISGIDFQYGQAKYQTVSGSNAISTNNAILLSANTGNLGYIYNSTELGEITKFEVFVNDGASAKAAIAVDFSTSVLSSAKSTPDNLKTLSDKNVIYEPTNIPAGSTYFRITSQGADQKACQIQVRITCEAQDPSAPALELSLNNAGPVPSSLNYNSSSYLIYANSGEEEQLDVDWSVSDNTVLSISENGNHVGVLTTLKPGTSTLSVSKEGYKSASVSITVDAGTVESVVVSGSFTKTTYSENESWSHAGLVATVSYSTGYSYDGAADAAWTYSPAAPAENVTSVVATATLGGKSGSSAAQAVTVTVAHGTSEHPFSVSEAIQHIDAGDLDSSTTYYVEGLYVSTQTPWNTTFKNITYNVTDPADSTKAFQFYRMSHTQDPACTAGDLIKVSCVGEKIIKYNSTYECSTCTFVSKSTLTIPLTGIELSAPTDRVRVGDTLTITPSFIPASTTDAKTVNWTSSDTSIATVSSSGVVTGVAIGTATITATSTVRNTVYGTFDVKVKSNSIDGDYVLTYNTTSEHAYNTAMTAAEFASETYVNGFDSMYFDQPSTIGSVYVNNSPYASYFSFAGHGSTTGTLALSLKDGLTGYVITKVLLKDAVQVNISGNTDIATLTESTCGISYQMTNSQKDYAFYPFNESFELQVSGNRIFASTIIITVEATTGSGQMATIVGHYGDAILTLTQEGCSASSVSEAEWTRVKQAYTRITTKYGNAASYISDWTLEDSEPLRRYKAVIEKYGYEDFMDRGYSKLSNSFKLFESDSSMSFILIAAITSLVALSAIVVIRKKKQAR